MSCIEAGAEFPKLGGRHGDRGRARRVVLLDRLLDLALGSDHHLHVAAGHELQVVRREDVQRVGHGDGQHVALARDGDERLVAHHVLGHQADDLHGDVTVLRERDVGDAALAPQEGEEDVLAAELHLLEDVAQLAAALALQLDRLVELLARDDAHVDQDVAELLLER
jgi:hypothetical protein